MRLKSIHLASILYWGIIFHFSIKTKILNSHFTGTVFSSKHLELQKNARKFASVFAKRLAYSAVPRDCTECECTSLHNGLSFMECTPCTYPRTNMEHQVSTFIKFNATVEKKTDYGLKILIVIKTTTWHNNPV